MLRDILKRLGPEFLRPGFSMQVFRIEMLDIIGEWLTYDLPFIQKEFGMNSPEASKTKDCLLVLGRYRATIAGEKMASA